MTGALGALKAGVVGVCGDGQAVLVVEGLGRRPPLAHRCDDDVVLHSIPKLHSSSQAYRNLQSPPSPLHTLRTLLRHTAALLLAREAHNGTRAS